MPTRHLFVKCATEKLKIKTLKLKIICIQVANANLMCVEISGFQLHEGVCVGDNGQQFTKQDMQCLTVAGWNHQHFLNQHVHVSVSMNKETPSIQFRPYTADG